MEVSVSVSVVMAMGSAVLLFLMVAMVSRPVHWIESTIEEGMTVSVAWKAKRKGKST
jgi:hypothetical protein